MKTVKLVTFAFVALFLLGIGWLSYSTLTQSEFLQSDGEQTRAAVLNRIPLGTAITRAAEIMKSEGFECVRMHSAFADDTRSGKQISHPAADILYCNHEHMTWWPISKRWQIILVEENAVVSPHR